MIYCTLYCYPRYIINVIKCQHYTMEAFKFLLRNRGHTERHIYWGLKKILPHAWCQLGLVFRKCFFIIGAFIYFIMNFHTIMKVNYDRRIVIDLVEIECLRMNF